MSSASFSSSSSSFTTTTGGVASDLPDFLIPGQRNRLIRPSFNNWTSYLPLPWYPSILPTKLADCHEESEKWYTICKNISVPLGRAQNKLNETLLMKAGWGDWKKQHPGKNIAIPDGAKGNGGIRWLSPC